MSVTKQSPKKSSQLALACCPFWQDRDQSCSCRQEGLILPEAEYVRLFCRNDNYPSCGRYVESARFGGNASPRHKQADKRSCKRVPMRLSLHLVVPAGHDEGGPVMVMDDAAQTVDIGEKGLRFESRNPVQVGAMVEFSLQQEDNDLSLPLRGSGRVQWCKALDQAPLFHAGIAFSSQTVTSVINTKLTIF